MASWISIAGTAALSLLLPFIFLRLRFRGVGPLFGAKSGSWAVAVIVMTGMVSTAVGILLALTTHNAAIVYLALLVPTGLWLPNAATERIRKRGSLLPDSLAG